MKRVSLLVLGSLFSLPCAGHEPPDSGEFVAARAAKAWNLPPSKDQMIGSTYLLNISQGSTLSGRMAAFRGQGYESSDGDRISFQGWYSTRWTELKLDWLTMASRNTGIIWGIGTGEHGEKYRINPSLKIGFIHSIDLTHHASLTFSATTVLGGRLKEKTCQADFGEIGGVQTTNCRLAATPLTSEEALAYLIDERPRSAQASIRYQWQF